MTAPPAVTAAEPAGQPPMRVLLPLALCTLIWGSTWTAIRYQLGTVDHNWSIAYRFAIATVAMVGLARFYRAPIAIRWENLPLVIAIALMQFTINFVCIYAAEGYIASGLVAMIFALLVVPNALFGRIFLGQRVGLSFMVGVLMAIGGMVLLFHPQIAKMGARDDHVLLGVGLTLAGVLSASAGNLFQASRRAGTIHWATLLLWGMGLAALFNALLALALAGAPQWDPRPEYWFATIYLALAGSALTFPIYLSVIRRIGPARAAYSGIITPIVAMGLSTLLEGYVWTPEAVAGSLLAVAGLYFAMRTRSPAR